MDNTNTEIIAVRVTPEFKKRLQDLAKKRDQSVPALLRTVARKELENDSTIS